MCLSLHILNRWAFWLTTLWVIYQVIDHSASLQVLKCIDKDKDGKLTETDLMGVLFVPLKGATASQSKEE